MNTMVTGEDTLWWHTSKNVQFGFSRNEWDTVETVDDKIIRQKQFTAIGYISFSALNYFLQKAFTSAQVLDWKSLKNSHFYF